jgi:hypothetical protein
MINFHFFLFGACVNAEAATFFTAAGVFGLLKSFPAVDATDFEVRSLRAMGISLLMATKATSTLRRQTPYNIHATGKGCESLRPA